MHPQRPPRRRTLEDVLHDPYTEWDEIRDSLKASGGCTNFAIIGAISNNGMTNAGVDRVVTASRDVVDNHDETSEAQEDASSCKDGNKGVALERTESPEFAGGAASSAKPHEGDGPRQPATSNKGKRVGFIQKSEQAASPLGELRRRVDENEKEQRQSVNIMDFGVDNHITLSDSTCSSAGSSSDHSDASENGFIGWNHSRATIAKRERGLLTQRSDSALLSSLRSSGGQSNYSDLVDDEGFLDWKRKSITLNDLENESLGEDCNDGQSISRNDTDLPPHASPANGPNRLRSALLQSLNSSKSILAGSLPLINFTDPFSKTDQKKDWKIECYEDPCDDSAPAEACRQQRGGGFSTRSWSFRRWSTSGTVEPGGAASNKGEVNVDDVKEALIKISKSSAKGPFTASASRRLSLNENVHIAEEKLQTAERGCLIIGSQTIADPKNDVIGAAPCPDTRNPSKDDSVDFSTTIRSNATQPTDGSTPASMQGMRQMSTGPAFTPETKKIPASGATGIDPNYILSRMVTVSDGVAGGIGIRVASIGDFQQKMKEAPKSPSQSCTLMRSDLATVKGTPQGKNPSKSILSRIPLLTTTEKSTDENIWNSGQKGASHQLHHNDTREAILINKKDGHLDIAKERRKLYSREQEEQGRGLLSRPSLPSLPTMSASSCATLSKGLSSCVTLSTGLERSSVLSSLGSHASGLGLKKSGGSGSRGQCNDIWQISGSHC